MENSSWEYWLDEALARLESLKLLRSLRPIYPSSLPRQQSTHTLKPIDDNYEVEVFEEMQPWDRSSVEVLMSDPTFQKWLLDVPSSGLYPLLFVT